MVGAGTFPDPGYQSGSGGYQRAFQLLRTRFCQSGRFDASTRRHLWAARFQSRLAWQYPTIGALAAHLSDDTDHQHLEKSPARLLPATTWNQPIAVIGMACRFPGAPDPAAFWDLLRSGRSAFREITSDRWDINAWYDPDLGKAGKMNARMAGLLERIDEFDPGFFGISPREAIQMDPQQRLALELTWEALEDAGLKPDALRGSRTGLFVGVVWHDYETIARKAGAEITSHSGTGQALGIVANRISYALGLAGAEHRSGHGLLLLAGQRASGLPQPASRRCDSGSGRRREL